jgi:MATE family multidrug resistance protein
MTTSYEDSGDNVVKHPDSADQSRLNEEDNDDAHVDTEIAQIALSDDKNDKRPKFTSSQHVQQIVAISGPIILSEIFQNTLPLVDIAFVGRLTSKQDLAAAALATVWFNLWNATMLGFCTAIDTLLSQAQGAKEYETFAMWSGNGMFIVSLVSLLVAGLVALCEPMMVAFGQDPALAAAAGQFSYRLIPGLVPLYLFKVLVKHLQAQNILAPGVLIGIFANLFNVLANWLLISYFSLGLQGAPWATSITRCIEFIMIVSYFYWKKSTSLSKTWPSFSFKNLKSDVVVTFLKLATTSALSFTAEAWSFEITTIFAGLLGTVALDAHIITLSIATFLYLSFPFAISVASSITIGQFTGEGKSADAKRSCWISFLLAVGVQATLIAILWPSRNVLGSFFSNDEEVSSLVSKLIPLSCIFMMGDSFQSCVGGALRGLGHYKLFLLVNIIGYWLLALPCGALLTFVADIGVRGLWWGMSIGIYSSSFVGMMLLKYYINWDRETELAKDRMSVARQLSAKPNQDTTV